MDSRQSQAMFTQADELFRGGNPGEAVKLLQQLDKAYPNRVDILFPALLCLEKLGQKQQAIHLADRLVREFNDSRARVVRDRLAPSSAYAPPGNPSVSLAGSRPIPGTVPSNPNLNAVAGVFEREWPRQPVNAPARGSRLPRFNFDWSINWDIETTITVSVTVGVLFFLGLLLTVLHNQGVAISDLSDLPKLHGTQKLLAFLATQLLGFAAMVPSGWLTLLLFKNLHHGEFMRDIVDVGMISLVYCVVGLVPLVGWIIGLVAIARHYELSCGSLFLTMLLWGVLIIPSALLVVLLCMPFALLWSAVL